MALDHRKPRADTGAVMDAELLGVVVEGLSAAQKWLPPKLFYDEIGSRLFERICEQPEYYIPAAERWLLKAHANALAQYGGPACVLIEPGAGSAEKSLLLLQALDKPLAYVPVEISSTALAGSVARVRAAMPDLQVQPLCADFTRAFQLPKLDWRPWTRRIVFMPGPTIGNFAPHEARSLMADWRRLAGPRGLLVLGVDLLKPREVLEPAYDDAAGVTAAFNLNLLARLNRELQVDFDLDAFAHRAWFNQAERRVEMHLVSRRAQQVRIGTHSFSWTRGETIHTENSYKYAPADFAVLALDAGWFRRELWVDPHGRFSLQCFEARR